MIYYNESVILDESGFDAIDALMECPIYDRYNDMISSISEYGFISESEKIEFRVLEENVFETIGNALKKAWKAIADFFRGLAGRISGFFKKISTKKIKDAVDKSIEKKEKELKEELKQVEKESGGNEAERKRKLLKKYGVDGEALLDYIENKDNNGNFTNYAALDADKLVKETIRTNGYVNMKKLAEKLTKTYLDNTKGEHKSKESAEKDIKMFEQIKIDDSCKTVKIQSKEIKNKINQCIAVDKAKSLISSDMRDGFLMPKGQKKLVDFYYGFTKVNLKENNLIQKLFKDVSNFADDMSKKIETIERVENSRFKAGDETAHTRKVVSFYIKKQKELLGSFNSDKGGLQQISGAILKAYKDGVKIIMGTGTPAMKKQLEKDNVLGSDYDAREASIQRKLKQSKERAARNESYDPWAGLNESYDDPWAGLNESYDDPWAGLE